MIISLRQRQWIKAVNPNRGILVFCGIYAAIALSLLTLAAFTPDAKGAVVLQQLAIAPAMIFATVLHLAEFISDRPWLNNFYAGFVASLLVIYLVGWALIVLASFEAIRGRE